MVAKLELSPKVLITPEARVRLDTYIAVADGEVSGLGTVEVHDGNLVVTNVYLLEQESSVASTVMGCDAISKFLVDCVKKGIDTSTIRLWWHSHAKMSVYWSGTDEKTIQELSGGYSWMVSIVGNKHGEYLSRIDVREPFNIIMDDVGLITHLTADETTVEEITKEVKEKVSVKKWKGGKYPRKGGKNFYPASIPFIYYDDCYDEPEESSEDPVVVNQIVLRQLGE